MIRDLIEKNRSYRRFRPGIKISTEQMEHWIDLARLSPSAKNIQPLKFAIINTRETCQKIFPHLGWAGYLTDWPGPSENERPSAYIAVLHDNSLADKRYCDDGIAMQSILLGAVEDGFGGCIIGSVNKSKAAGILQLPGHLEILWLMALGKPAERVQLETTENNNIEYWRDKNDVHHVPKRPLKEIILKF